MDKKLLETFEELDKAVMEEAKLRLKTPGETCTRANEIDNGLHHKEQPRLTIWAYIWENFKKEFKIIFRF